MEQFKIKDGGDLEKSKISPENINRYMAEIDTVLKMEVNLALRGYEDGKDIYKPWSLNDIKGFCESIITFVEQKIKLYERAGYHEEIEASQTAQ